MNVYSLAFVSSFVYPLVKNSSPVIDIHVLSLIFCCFSISKVNTSKHVHVSKVCYKSFKGGLKNINTKAMVMLAQGKDPLFLETHLFSYICWMAFEHSPHQPTGTSNMFCSQFVSVISNDRGMQT